MKIESLEVKNEINEIRTQIAELLDVFYPKGSFYETTNSNFDPNTEWGGTWKQDTKGYVTVGAYDPDDPRDPDDNGKLILNLGSTTGEVKHTLTIGEMPSHKHSLTSWRNPGQADPQPTTGFGFTRDSYAFSNVATDGDGTSFTANDSVAIGATGSGNAHNNVQPSIGVYRWHRIA